MAVSLSPLVRKILGAVAGLAVMALLLAWLMGAFRERVAPAGPQPVLQELHGPVHRIAAVAVPRTETAVGTIRAVRETVVSSRILGRIANLHVTRAGQPVSRDELLVELESADLLAVVEQARAALRVAETRRDKARVDFDRTAALVQQEVAAKDRLDADRANLMAAEAEVERARQAVGGAESSLQFARITAPIAGIVVDKQVNAGDVVQPGQPICTLYDPTHLQLVAVVREELAGRLAIGQPVKVTLEALGKDCEGQVSEIVPATQAASRAFEVKVTGPCQPGIVTGMFGRLHVPLGEERLVLVPRAAVQRIGQLDFAWCRGTDGVVARRYLRLGRELPQGFEVLSGLREGEDVVLQGTGG